MPDHTYQVRLGWLAKVEEANVPTSNCSLKETLHTHSSIYTEVMLQSEGLYISYILVLLNQAFQTL